MSRLRVLSCLAVAFGALVAPDLAQAQVSTFSTERLRVGGGPEDGVGIWRPEVSEKPLVFGQFMLGFALNPFRIEHHIQDDAQADIMSARSGAPLKAQINTYANVGVEFLQRFQLQLMLPVTVFQSGNETVAPGVTARDSVNLDPAGAGDLRLEARGVIFRTDDRFYKLGANANLFFPTGNEQSWLGDKSTSGGFGVANELDFEDLQLVLGTGLHFRPLASVNDFQVGHEWNWAFGAFVPLRGGTMRVGAQLFGSTMVSGDEAFSAEGTPLEWLAEARFALDDDKRLYLGGHGGTRLTPGYAPDMRLGAFIGYSIPIADTEPPSPGQRKRFDTFNDNVDTDKDGYPDSIDLCPTEPEDGKPPFVSDGCPAEADRDGDGIPDSRDKCPDQPEDFDGVDDLDGCPEDDADKDGIADAQDKCPKEPGVASPDPEKNGCPQFIRRISGSSEIQVLKKVEFEFGSARLSPASFPILDEVFRLLEANPDITLMAIEGHTDNRGGDALNLRLSKDRARSCLDYLVQKGIAAGRLSSDGFGKDKPIESNDTADGRAKNRRVEFHIRNQAVGAGGSSGAASPGGAQPEGPVPGQ